MTRRIPTEADFARADAEDAKRNRGLSDICERIVNKYKLKNIHKVFAFYSQRGDSFGFYIFYNFDYQIKEARDSGLEEVLKRDVLQELEIEGRGKMDKLKVDFEFDSHENVEKNYEGDYFLRLR
ncbi:MAG: hypothetical protein LEGION0403_FIIPPAGN_02142 [Legionella sp.]|uniref:hypothetical protein n=1 Tax=Legionella sp. TaxID=459 RepID=UPI003D0BD322